MGRRRGDVTSGGDGSGGGGGGDSSDDEVDSEGDEVRTAYSATGHGNGGEAAQTSAIGKYDVVANGR